MSNGKIFVLFCFVVLLYGFIFLISGDGEIIEDCPPLEIVEIIDSVRADSLLVKKIIIKNIILREIKISWKINCSEENDSSGGEKRIRKNKIYYVYNRSVFPGKTDTMRVIFSKKTSACYAEITCTSREIKWSFAHSISRDQKDIKKDVEEDIEEDIELK